MLYLIWHVHWCNRINSSTLLRLQEHLQNTVHGAPHVLNCIMASLSEVLEIHKLTFKEQSILDMLIVTGISTICSILKSNLEPGLMFHHPVMDCTRYHILDSSEKEIHRDSGFLPIHKKKDDSPVA